MKIKIEKKKLVQFLGRPQNIVEKRNTMPILVNVLLEVNESKLTLFATDLEVSFTDEINVHVVEPGKAAVNAKQLFDIVRELSEGPITLQKKNNNWLEVKQNKSVFNIVGIPADEYPVFPSYSTEEFIEFNPSSLKDMIEKTIYSVSNDETRYHLNGVFFETINKKDQNYYRMVATDGHRLSLIDILAQPDDQDVSEGVIIPRKGLNEIKKLIENAEEKVQLAVQGSQLIVKCESATLLIRLIEGKYPNYNKLIPETLPKNIEIQKDVLLSSLKRVSLMSNQKSKGVTFTISSKGKMEITSNNPDLGDAKEEIDVEYDGEDLKIGFNAKYILDVLGSLEDNSVNLGLDGQLSPGMIRPKDNSNYTCVVMPMRI